MNSFHKNVFLDYSADYNIWGKPPSDYVPGKWRGAVALTGGVSRKDGSIRLTYAEREKQVLDLASGNVEDSFAQKLYKASTSNEEIKNANEFFALAQELATSRKTKTQSIQGQSTNEIQSMFSDIRDSLKTITHFDWINLPDVKRSVTVKEPDQPLPQIKTLQELKKTAVENIKLMLEPDINVAPINEQVLANGASISRFNELISILESENTHTTDTKPGISSYIDDKQLDRLHVITLLKNMVKTNPTNPRGWLMLAQAEYESGNIKQSISIIKNGCKKCQSSVELWKYGADILNGKERLAFLKKALVKVPDSADLWLTFINHLKEDSTTCISDLLTTFEMAVKYTQQDIRLWKGLIELTPDHTKPSFIRRALIHFPNEISFWAHLISVTDEKEIHTVFSEALKSNANSLLLFVKFIERFDQLKIDLPDSTYSLLEDLKLQSLHHTLNVIKTSNDLLQSKLLKLLMSKFELSYSDSSELITYSRYLLDNELYLTQRTLCLIIIELATKDYLLWELVKELVTKEDAELVKSLFDIYKEYFVHYNDTNIETTVLYLQIKSMNIISDKLNSQRLNDQAFDKLYLQTWKQLLFCLSMNLSTDIICPLIEQRNLTLSLKEIICKSFSQLTTCSITNIIFRSLQAQKFYNSIQDSVDPSVRALACNEFFCNESVKHLIVNGDHGNEGHNIIREDILLLLIVLCDYIRTGQVADLDVLTINAIRNFALSNTSYIQPWLVLLQYYCIINQPLKSLAIYSECQFLRKNWTKDDVLSIDILKANILYYHESICRHVENIKSFLTNKFFNNVDFKSVWYKYISKTVQIADNLLDESSFNGKELVFHYYVHVRLNLEQGHYDKAKSLLRKAKKLCNRQRFKEPMFLYDLACEECLLLEIQKLYWLKQEDSVKVDKLQQMLRPLIKKVINTNAFNSIWFSKQHFTSNTYHNNLLSYLKLSLASENLLTKFHECCNQ